MSDGASDDSDPARSLNDEFEPEEGAYTTSDHQSFFQFGRLAVVVGEGAEWAHVQKEHMDQEQFWPNVWFVSDHRNAHLLDMYDELAEADRPVPGALHRRHG